ncbi:hypothetical protein [Clostridium botulinum]|uniref:hypothetical protein n=3 Tax=Clostridium botulinum TaxID=1491 RepID=UPI00068B1B01|nr:hypothetical protein [Clostridium botulinum]MCD3232670.1 hypothetical protein [Clostridium botulinum D/C]MCD3238400.1 hypothetical protein [Clostridium botulinum D/C]MCD3266080.1 hypothetical protein [Clostridium botulinum D/C]MCD3300803.1 hypothetical protein [Clostridium botulinum D/C]MCD3304319.1 hypothetical protein [Clostridium botulinum D/C]
MDNKKNQVNKKIPVIFQKLDQYESEYSDIRFLKVKIWLMHLGENFNGSYFSKEVVENAIPSLSNTPILTYIETNSSGEEDFSDHRTIIVVKNGEQKFKYLGQAIGVIPESNNAQFEMRLCDDGIEREFLTVEGLIWAKWDNPIEIFENQNIKPQSMELASDYTGEFKEDKLFHFTDFKFFGACALGSDIEPAMINSTIEAQFSKQSIFEDIQVYMEQFKKFNKNKENGSEVKDMGKNKTNFSLSTENLIDEIRKVLRERKIIVKDYWGDSYEENEFYYRDIKDDVVVVISNDWTQLYGIPCTVSGDTVTLDFDNKVPYVSDFRPKEDGDTEVEINFSSILNNRIKYSVEKAQQKAQDEINIVETEEYKTLNTEYTKLKSQLDEFSKKKDIKENNNSVNEQFSNLQSNYDDLKSKFDTINKEFECLKKTNSELEEVKNEFEKEKLTQSVDKSLKEFSFTDEEVKDIRKQAINQEISLDELKEKCYVLVGKKALQGNQQFTSAEYNEKASVRINNTENTKSIYGELTNYFENLNK